MCSLISGRRCPSKHGKITSAAGWSVYLSFIAFISLALGFVNLLPIPILDGGHFVFLLLEGIFRRPVPEKVQAVATQVGFILLVILILFVTRNDLIRIFS